MKNTPRFLTFVLTIFTVLLGACSGTATPVSGVGGDKAQAMPVAFTGLVQSITGNQWVINGQALTVDPAVVRNGHFNIGDRVKLEGVMNQDGSFTVSGVQTPSAQDLSRLPQFGGGSNDPNSNDDNEDNANINDNDANSNDDNSNDENVNDDDSDENSNDENSNDANVNDDNGNEDNGNDANVNDNTNSSDEDNGGGDNGAGGGSNDGGGNDDDDGSDDGGGDDDGG